LKVARWAHRFKISVIHCNEHDVYPFAILVRRLLGLPLVCHVRFRLERGFCEWAFGGKGKRPDALLWTSHQQRQDCAEAIAGLVPDSNQHVVRLGIDPDTFGGRADGRCETRRSWGFGPESVIVGTASALRPRKRIEDFVEVVARLARQDDRVVGVLAGDAAPGDEGYRDEILTEIRATGLDGRFRWLGDLEHVEPFFHAIDIFVSTSEYETFGNSVCEAMACRRPVVAYRGGSIHEVAGDAGRIVENGDLSALETALRELVSCPVQRNELGALAHRRVADQFNPAKSLQQLKGIYATLLRNR
jgi:glycosyltransferase involved in cell wall biosynthesis